LAIVSHHWQCVAWDYWFDRGVDMAIIALFTQMSYFLHNEQLPPAALTFLLVGLNLLYIWKVAANAWVAHAVFDHDYSTRCFFVRIFMSTLPMMTFWNVMYMLLDVYVVVVLWLQFWEDFSYRLGINHNFWLNNNNTTMGGCHAYFVGDISASWLSPRNFNETMWFKCAFPGRHPDLMFFVVTFRWIYFLLMILAWAPIGRDILPVYEAMKCKESVVFLLYVSMMCLGLIHMYYTFPLTDDHLRDAVQKVLRVFFINDFDLLDLQNVDQVLAYDDDGNPYDPKKPSNDHPVSLGDGDPNKHIQNGIWAFASIGVFSGSIMFMNIYIGLLSNAYERMKDNANELFTKYRINVAITLLFRQEFHLWCAQWFEWERWFQSPPEVDDTYWWIRVPVQDLSETSEREAARQATSQELHDLREEVTDELVKISEINDKVDRIFSLLNKDNGQAEEQTT